MTDDLCAVLADESLINTINAEQADYRTADELTRLIILWRHECRLDPPEGQS